MKQILGAMRKAIVDFDMISEGDKIAVGLSGGKDSMTMLYALKLFQRFSPVSYDLHAVTIDLGFNNFDVTAVREYCDKIEVPFTSVSTEIAKIVFDIRKETNPCSLCTKMRKGALHNYVNEIGFNKVALGHHGDDVIETMFLSMLYEGRISTFKPVSFLDRSKVHSIRPFVYVKESQVVSAIKKHEIPVVISPCPMDKNTKREEVKQILKHIYKSVPQGRERLMTSIQNKENLSLW